jgi:hypothetical protein
MFSPLTMLEGEDSNYQLTFLVARTTATAPEEVPAPTQFSDEQGEYQVDTAPQNPAPAAGSLAAFNALLAYYNTNKTGLLASHAENLAAQAARQAELQNNPPQPQDITINIWPIRGSLFLSQ